MPFNLTQEQLPLINMLLRIAVMAGIISLVVGFRFVVKYLTGTSAAKGSQIRFGILLAVVFIAGVLVRKFANQAAIDLSLEGALLAGLLGGVWVGTGVGVAIGLSCFLLGETVGLPFYAGAGFISGLLFSILGVRGETWSYSLNPIFIVYNFLERLLKGRLDRNFIPFALCLVFALLRYEILRRLGSPRLLYGYVPPNGVLMALDLTVMVYTLGLALKIAYNTRFEMILREEERQLIHARLATLRSQINPHFLFNTLNSISALIRTDAERAREMTRKLSAIFRKSLEDYADTHSLEDEIRFIDDYLSIERVRFGEEKLRIVKNIEPGALGMEVPSMILQPLVENAIKHGISKRTEGGLLKISARIRRGGVDIRVENEGPAGSSYELSELFTRGTGLRNVYERMKIYTCGDGDLSISPRQGGGVEVKLYLPRIEERRRDVADRCLDR